MSFLAFDCLQLDYLLADSHPEAHVAWMDQEDHPDKDCDEIASEEEHVLASRRADVRGEPSQKLRSTGNMQADKWTTNSPGLTPKASP